MPKAKTTVKVIESIESVRGSFPNAYEYLTRKRPTQIYVDGDCVVLENSFHGVTLRYDIHDIQQFDKIGTNGETSSAD